MYRSSMYLMAEECHPMMFDLELENPELLLMWISMKINLWYSKGTQWEMDFM